MSGGRVVPDVIPGVRPVRELTRYSLVREKGRAWSVHKHVAILNSCHHAEGEFRMEGLFGRQHFVGIAIRAGSEKRTEDMPVTGNRSGGDSWKGDGGNAG